VKGTDAEDEDRPSKYEIRDVFEALGKH